MNDIFIVTLKVSSYIEEDYTPLLIGNNGECLKELIIRCFPNVRDADKYVAEKKSLFKDENFIANSEKILSQIYDFRINSNEVKDRISSKKLNSDSVYNLLYLLKKPSIYQIALHNLHTVDDLKIVLKFILEENEYEKIDKLLVWEDLLFIYNNLNSDGKFNVKFVNDLELSVKEYFISCDFGF